MYDLVSLFGVAGAGKDTVAEIITRILPGWHSVGVSEPLLREYESRQSMPPGYLDDAVEKRRLRPQLSQLAAEILSHDPGWMIDRCLHYPRPLVVVGARPLFHLNPLRDYGALMIEISTTRENRVTRIGEDAVLIAEADPFEVEMLTYLGERLTLENNGTIDDLEQAVKTQITSLLMSA